MAVSLPERTVDAWMVLAIRERFSAALFWSPTFTWDLGTAIPAKGGKTLLFEHKTMEPCAAPNAANNHALTLDQRERTQLHKHCASPWPIYYILPKPPWSEAPQGLPIPLDAAAQRPACVDWFYVIEANDLRTYLNATGGWTINMAKLLQAQPAPVLRTLGAFLDAVEECDEPPPGAPGSNAHGGAGRGDLPPDAPGPVPPTGTPDDARGQTGLSLGVFLPGLGSGEPAPS